MVVEEIGIGLLAGARAGSRSAPSRCERATVRGWLDGNLGRHCPSLALAAASFAAAQALGGSGFIACFVGGLAFNALRPPEKHALLRGAEGTGEALAFATWVVFGSAVIVQIVDRITVAVVIYALLSLTVVRMLPVFLSLLGTKLSTSDRLFVGWFGPRGLASVVFAILILDAGVPGIETLGGDDRRHHPPQRRRCTASRPTPSIAALSARWRGNGGAIVGSDADTPA